MDNVFYTESPQLVNRDADGKFAPQCGSHWLENEEKRQECQASKWQRLQAEMGGFLADTGMSMDVATAIFA